MTAGEDSSQGSSARPVDQLLEKVGQPSLLVADLLAAPVVGASVVLELAARPPAASASVVLELAALLPVASAACSSASASIADTLG